MGMFTRPTNRVVGWNDRRTLARLARRHGHIKLIRNGRVEHEGTLIDYTCAHGTHWLTLNQPTGRFYVGAREDIQTILAT